MSYVDQLIAEVERDAAAEGITVSSPVKAAAAVAAVWSRITKRPQPGVLNESDAREFCALRALSLSRTERTLLLRFCVEELGA